MKRSSTPDLPDMPTADSIGPLPINTVLPSLLEYLTSGNRCLLVAQPGAGKTTRVPLAILANQQGDSRRWLLLEPRRVAARLAAGFMADQLNEQVGGTIGYRVRGESRVSNKTRLEVVTQGILTRMLQDDPFLEGVEGIIFDEFHERSLEADLGLALALDIQTSLRDDLKILVMSATLDVASLLNILGSETPVIDCPGRTWPVEVVYRPAPPRQPVELHQSQVIQEALKTHDGDVLVFLPGQKEISQLYNRLKSAVPDNIRLCQLHGQLPLATQRAVLQPDVRQHRRIILSSAIAESSVTVPGVRIVVDAGLERVPVFQARTGLTRLETRRVNRASADQRGGRAGRDGPGVCFRLWSAETILADHREPEIRQADLAGLTYELLRWGISDPTRLKWVSPVPAPAFSAALDLLKTLRIVNESRQLTAKGRRCAQWPTHPRLAVMLDYAAHHGLQSQACWIVSFLEESTVVKDVDLMELFQGIQGTDAGENTGRLSHTARQWSKRLGCPLVVDDFTAVAPLLALGFPDRLAQNRGKGKFRLVSGSQAILPEDHPLASSPFLVITDLDGKASGARIYSAATIARETIESLFPHSLEWKVESRWDGTEGRLITDEVRGIGSVELARRTTARKSPEAVSAALLAAVRQRGNIRWSRDDRQLLGRLRLAHRVLGTPWPDVSDASLLNDLEHWLAPHLININRLDEIDRLPLGKLVLDSLDWSRQQELGRLCPTHLKVPSGSRVKIDYTGDEPVLAVKLQEMFGQTETPAIIDGKVPLTIHLLSPAGRPVQVTRDLASFWANTYYEVRKDLKGRYSKHPWPEDPLLAEPTRKTRKRL